MTPLETIAEISGCHGGSLENAKRLILHAHEAGATGVKFQCFEPSRLAEKRYKHSRLEAGEYTHAYLLGLYHQIHTPHEWFPKLIETAKQLGLTWHASVFDPDDVTFLEALDCPRYKVSSFETFDNDLVLACMKTNKPLIISVNQGDTYQPPKHHAVTILHATDYDVPAHAANLRRLKSWAFHVSQLPWGLSDHTNDSPNIAGTIATVYGAVMIEWHIKLPGVGTPDHSFAWLPTTFTTRVKSVMAIRRALYE